MHLWSAILSFLISLGSLSCINPLGQSSLLPDSDRPGGRASVCCSDLKNSPCLFYICPAKILSRSFTPHPHPASAPDQVCGGRHQQAEIFRLNPGFLAAWEPRGSLDEYTPIPAGDFIYRNRKEKKKINFSTVLAKLGKEGTTVQGTRQQFFFRN